MSRDQINVKSLPSPEIVAAVRDHVFTWAAFRQWFSQDQLGEVILHRYSDLDLRDLLMTEILDASAPCPPAMGLDGLRSLNHQVRRTILMRPEAVENDYQTPIGKALRGENPWTPSLLQTLISGEDLPSMRSALSVISRAGPQAPGYEVFRELSDAVQMAEMIAHRDETFALSPPSQKDIAHVDLLLSELGHGDLEAVGMLCAYFDRMMERTSERPQGIKTSPRDDETPSPA